MSIGARRLARRFVNAAASGENILSGKTFVSDVTDSINEPGHSAALITDGNTSTRWIS